MFTEDMVAPCGLDCSVCVSASDKQNPCLGCLGSNKNKLDFCANQCMIVRCEKRVKGGYRFCDECPDYPCWLIERGESLYMNRFPLKESPKENLRMIREEGMDEYLRRQKEKWTCGKCGGVISVQTGRCNGCGGQYGDTASSLA